MLVFERNSLQECFRGLTTEKKLGACLLFSFVVIFDYAFCGGEIGFNRMIQYLSENAEEEKWTFDDTKPNSILKKYIIGTFSQCFKQNKILVSEDGNFDFPNVH